MPRLAAACAMLLGIVTAAPAQSPADRAAVERAGLDYLEGFYEGDSLKLARSVSPQVRKNGYYRESAAAPYNPSAMPYPAFFQFAAGVRAGRNLPPSGAPKQVVVFDVQDQTASIKVTAWWGTDYMLLGKENGRWVITHILWQSPPGG